MTLSTVLHAMWAAVAGATPPTLPPTRVVHRLVIEQFVFLPARLEVPVGDVVEWTNHDFVPHTSTANGGVWRSGSIANGASWRFVARAPGSYAYVCSFHPQMKGTIVVTRRASHGAARPKGTAAP